MEYVNGLSRLGLGCMRLPKSFEESEKIVMRSLELGINYFDTAYIYPGNEEKLGKIMMKNGCREQMHIATKVPHYLVKTLADVDKHFDTSLRRLQTDYIDSYLMHMLPDLKTWQRLKDLGIEEWIEKKKAQGQIKRIGFSFHGNTQSFLDLIDAYPWEFVQVQYNYLDEHTQAGRTGVEYAASKGIPVIIMEPLRGGLLVDKLPRQAAQLVDEKAAADANAGQPSRSAAEWGLKWLWDQPAISTSLSGMNTLEMLDENVRICNETSAGSLTAEEMDFYTELKKAIRLTYKIGCTGCNYCMPCPYGVNIPGCFGCYNSSYANGLFTGIKEYFMVTVMSSDASYAGLCRNCGKCTKLCSQMLDIPKLLNDVSRRFEKPGFGVLRWFLRRFFLKERPE